MSEVARPTLILLHGATLNGRMWDAVRRDLDPRWRIFAPDLPGHGSRCAEPYTLAGAMTTVVSTAKIVPAAPVILVGDSLGAYTAMASAQELPADQLKGLVLGGATFNFVGSRAMPHVIKGKLLTALSAVFGEPRIIDKVANRAFGPAGFNLSPEDGRAIIEAGMSVTVFNEAVMALRGVDFRRIFAGIPQPVLIVNGTQDKINIDDEPSFLAASRDASSHHFEGCGHGVSLWRPRELAELVNNFAAQVFSKSASHTDDGRTR